jgi:hypothetical protein
MENLIYPSLFFFELDIDNSFEELIYKAKTLNKRPAVQ